MPTFFQVSQHDAQTSRGPVPLPILYYDVSTFNAFFRIEVEAAEAVLQGTDLSPMVFGGKAFAAMAFFEYRKTSIGAYNEVGLCLATYPREDKQPPNALRDFLRLTPDRVMGMHVLDLPVSTEAAFSAGREIWGYPKFVANIPLSFEKREFEGSVMDPDKDVPIFRLAGPFGHGPSLPGIDLVLYSHLAGVRIKTVVDVNASFVTARAPRMSLKVGHSTHRMAENLRALGLDGASPSLVQNSRYFRSRLHAGKTE